MDELTIMQKLKDHVVYYPSTGQFYSEKSNRFIGGRHAQGYILLAVRIEGKSRSVYGHRYAYFYMTGEVPEKVVHHIDGDEGNNRWSNLRSTTYTYNRTLAEQGYHRDGKQWQASLKIKGVQHKGPRRDTPEEAIRDREALLLEHYGEVL